MIVDYLAALRITSTYYANNQVTNMRDLTTKETLQERNDTYIATSLGLISDFLGDERDPSDKVNALALAKEELSKRPTVDESLLREDLSLKKLSIRNKFAYFTKCLVSDIRNGKYDGKPKERRLPLSSQNMFKRFKDLGVEDDSEDGFGYERVDYYLNAVWVNTEITIEEIHKFSEGMIVWIEAKKEWRTATKVLKLCRMSKTLGAHMPPEKAMEYVEREVDDCKALEKEWDEIMEEL